MRRITYLTVGAAVVTAIFPFATAEAAGTLPNQRWSATGDQPGEGYGWAVADMADIDGDGAREAIMSAPFHSLPTGEIVGHTDVRSGRTGDLVYRFDGQVQDVHGWAIADAGDVNGDEVHDVLVGAPQNLGQCTAPAFGAGRVYVYSGANGDQLLDVPGELPGDAFGYAVSSAGDIDGDGRDDLLVGAPCTDQDGEGSGRVYVVSGSTGSILRATDGDSGIGLGSATGALGDVDRDGTTDHVVGARDMRGGRGGAVVLSGATGRLIHTLVGDGTNEEMGTFFAAGAGDVNGDGVPDAYVADYAAGKHDRGRAYVFSGRTGKQLLVFTGERRSDGLGPGRSAGDVDHDGRPDLVIGSYTSNEGAPQAGKVRVFSGRTGAVLEEIVSTTANEQLGFDAVGLGDVNADGRIDLLLSAANGDAVYLVGS